MDIEREHERWTSYEREHGYIRARLLLLTTDEGGRTGPIASGYRPDWGFPAEARDEAHGAPLTIESEHDRWLNLGEETVVRLHPLAFHLWPNIEPGLRLTMLEGAQVVGVAEVLEVIKPE